jgi:uncharacterized protein (DUF433 family)
MMTQPSSTTTYRYITRVPGICGGRPIIDGTRTSVQALVGYYKLGMSLEEILEGLPQITPAQLHEALSYYYDHQDEIEESIREGQVKYLVERYDLPVTKDGRILPKEPRAE